MAAWYQLVYIFWIFQVLMSPIKIKRSKSANSWKHKGQKQNSNWCSKETCSGCIFNAVFIQSLKWTSWNTGVTFHRNPITVIQENKIFFLKKTDTTETKQMPEMWILSYKVTCILAYCCKVFGFVLFCFLNLFFKCAKYILWTLSKFC